MRDTYPHRFSMNTKETMAVTMAVLWVHSAIGQHLIAHYDGIPPNTNVTRLIFPHFTIMVLTITAIIICFPVMSLLIRYTHIPFYFRFSFAFPTSSIYHYAPPLRCDHTRSRSHDNRTRFIGPISLIWWTYDLLFTCIYFYSWCLQHAPSCSLTNHEVSHRAVRHFL